MGVSVCVGHPWFLYHRTLYQQLMTYFGVCPDRYHGWDKNEKEAALEVSGIDPDRELRDENEDD